MLFQGLIQVILGRMTTILADEYLTLAQIRLLFTLAHQGPCSINETARNLRTGQSAASLLVDRLVQTGLAERSDDPADRRRAIVQLSSRGEELMDNRLAGREKLLSWLRGLDDTRLTVVIETLTAMQELGEALSTPKKPSDDKTASK